MKKIQILLIFMGSMSLLFAQNNDEEAIKKVIADQSMAWANRDTTAYCDSYANNELTQSAYNNRNLSIGIS
jgi:predicted trehalose synthase